MPYTFYESMSKSTYHNGCARKMRAFIGGVLVNLTGTPNERHDGLLRVNINKEYTLTYQIQTKFNYEPDTAFLNSTLTVSLTIKVRCGNFSNSFLLTMPNNTNIQTQKVQDLPQVVPFEITNFAATQT